MEFSRQVYWSGLPFPTPGDLLNLRIEPASLASPGLAGGFFTTVTTFFQIKFPGSGRSAGKGLPTPVFLEFLCGSAGKESACIVGDLGSIPGLGRSPGEGKGYPLQYSGLENPVGRGIWRTTSIRSQNQT